MPILMLLILLVPAFWSTQSKLTTSWDARIDLHIMRYAGAHRHFYEASHHLNPKIDFGKMHSLKTHQQTIPRG